MANTSTIWQQAAHTTYHELLAAQQKPCRKSLTFKEKGWIKKKKKKKSGEWTVSRKLTSQKEQED